MELHDSIAIVTGSARGIGRGIALALARAGAHVVVADLGNTPDLEAAMDGLARDIRALGRRALVVKLDVRDAAEVSAGVDQALAEFGRIDILVNNAGVISVAPVMGMSEEQWDRVLDVNLKGAFLCSRAVAPHMAERRRGRIVNIASQAGKRGSPGLAHYCASKFGLIGFTQSLAHEMARFDVTVNAVCPGEVQTDMWDSHLSPALAASAGSTPREAWERFIRERVPLGRPQTAEDIGEAVVFLCRADNITGEALNVTGGSEMC